MLYVKDDFTKDLDLTNDEYFTYLGLLATQIKDIKLNYVTPDLLSYITTQIFPSNRQIIHSVIQGIKGLADKKLINVVDSVKQYEWIVDISNMEIKDKHYTVVNNEDIVTIMQSNNKHIGLTLALLRFYIFILSTLQKKKDDREGIGFTSQTEMSDIMGVTQKTVRSYLAKLVELKLIYIYVPECSVKYKNGMIKELTSTYGKWDIKEKVISYGKQYEDSFSDNSNVNCRKIDKTDSFKTRSASQKYNNMCLKAKKGEEHNYKYDECKDIYQTLLELNKRYPADSKYRRDLSIFSEYDFYQANI